ncbi:zinc metallochaperone AztD [Ornithinimicrobium sp. LYQ92]|uniref:zinc metallochaperone AztD n=1 Tax=Serinicoccus sp. LYQ92 TaxID=3378798 RepID=UPI0038518C94
MRTKTTPLILALTSATLLAACGPTSSDDAGDGNAPAGGSSDGGTTQTADAGDAASETDPAGTSDGAAGTGSADEAAETHESAGPSPRLALTYDGGVMVLDALDLEVEGDFPAEGFTRLNPAGDGRHMLLTEGESFRLLDAGTWSEPHGNHDHSYTTAPTLTDQRVEGSHPGHAVAHGGRTALYFDGAGRIDLLDPATLDIETSIDVDEAHHGVAVMLEDGAMLETVGTEDERTGARVLDANGDELASTDECPGVHGEATAEGGAVVLGCEDGLVVLADGAFTKISSPDDYGRIGNQAGSELSPVVLGDYKSDPDAELERPEQVSLTDTATGELQLVDLGTSYSFRSLARGPQGEALVLGTDGELHVIDPASGEVTQELPVVEEWTEPTEWQQPRPTLFVMGQFGYVTEPATQELHVVDLDAMEIIDSAELPQVPNEISGVSGRDEAAGSHSEDEHGDEDHGDEDHEGHDHGDEEHSDEDHEGHDH